MDPPLCVRFGSLLDDGVFEELGLDKTEYTAAFKKLKTYWDSKVPKHGSRYLMCAAVQLGKVLKSPEEWLEVGYKLADVTARIYARRNGSHSFVENAVTGIIDNDLVVTKEEVLDGIDALEGLSGPGEIIYEGIPTWIKRERIRTLDDLIRYIKCLNYTSDYRWPWPT